MLIVRLIKKLLQAVWYGLDTIRRVLHLLLLLFIFALLGALVGRERLTVPEKAALIVAPEGFLVEQLEGSALDRALADVQGDGVRQTLLPDLIESLEQAAADERIQAVVLELDGLDGGGLPKLQAVASALAKVRAAGKQVVAYGNGYTSAQYYLAAHADRIFMQELGLVYIDGFGYYRTFFRGALEKLKVDLNVFRVGEYKSFVEPYLRDDMSEADKEAARRWLDALWVAYQQDIGGARDLPAEALQTYANDFVAQLRAADGSTGQLALAAGLVDELRSREQLNEFMLDLVGPSDADDTLYSGIDFRAYRLATRAERLLDTKDENVGIIVASGTIVDGFAPPGTVGADSLVELIRRAAEDESVKAVVLRVDSPGGSMLASEIIADALDELKATGKPLVASMSSVAASGGYYISMPADEIWASPTTITGSIGVGAILPTLQRSLDALGVHVDGIGTTRLSGQLRLDRELGEDARDFLTLSVKDAYRVFVGKVASARDMSFDRADEMARGRVWIGSDALDLGLVDGMGGLGDAVASAAARAGLSPGAYGTLYVEPELSFAERLASEYAVRILAGHDWQVRPGGLVEQVLQPFREAERTLRDFNDPRGLYYHCFCGVW